MPPSFGGHASASARTRVLPETQVEHSFMFLPEVVEEITRVGAVWAHHRLLNEPDISRPVIYIPTKPEDLELRDVRLTSSPTGAKGDTGTKGLPREEEVTPLIATLGQNQTTKSQHRK